jgi:uncharacterized protein (TIGR04255 family)
LPGYLPYAGKNSIVEVSFGLQFALPLDAIISSKYEALRTSFLDEFPKFEKMQFVQFSVGSDQLSSAPMAMPQAVGFTASKIRENGTPSRVIRGVTNLLTAHFLVYDSWVEAKKQSLNALKKCMKILDAPSSQLPINAVLLRYIDRFTYDGESSDSSPTKLFKKTTQFLPANIFSKGALWHSNTGWFQEIDGSQALNQLNIQGILENSAAVVIDHNSICNLSKHVTALSGTPTLDAAIEKIFDAQHSTNEMLLKDLLDEDMLKNIGL